MPRGSMPHSLALLVALASPQPCPLAMQHTTHHGQHHGPMSLACSPLQSHSPLPILPPQPSRLLLASVMHMPPPTSTNTPYPPSPLHVRALPSLSLLRLVSANPMRKSASRPSLSVPVGWMASMLPPQITVLLSSPSLSSVPCLPSMLCLPSAMEPCSLPPS